MATATTPVNRMDERTFDTMREQGQLKDGVAYQVECFNGTAYAWSPDGDGFFWYDTLEELREQHG